MIDASVRTFEEDTSADSLGRLTSSLRMKESFHGFQLVLGKSCVCCDTDPAAALTFVCG